MSVRIRQTPNKGRGRGRGSSTSSPVPSLRQGVISERGLPPSATKKQGQKETEHVTAKDSKGDLLDKLCSRLQNACYQFLKESSEPSNGEFLMHVEGTAVTHDGSVERKKLESAIQNADRLIEKVTATSNTKAIKGKAKQLAEMQEKSKFTVVTDWLKRLENQIMTSKFDEKDFSKPKLKDGSNDEINKCHVHIVDCCRKLKINNEDRMRTDKEVKTLLKEIKDWTDVKPNDKKEGEEIETLLQDSRALLLEKKKDFKSANEELKCLRKEIEAWDDVKPLEVIKESNYELTKTIRSNRVKLAEKKKELNSVYVKKENELKEKQLHEKAIKELWEMIYSPKKLSDKNITKALDEIKEYVSGTQRQLKSGKVKKESELKEIQQQEKAIKELWEMIYSSKKLSEKNITKALDEIKEYVSDTQKQTKSGKVKKESELKETQQQEKAIKELWEMIYSPDNLSGKNITKAFDEIKEYVLDTQKQIKSVKDESEIFSKEIQNQEQEIKGLLEMICSDKDTSGKVHFATALDELKEHTKKQLGELDMIEKLSKQLEEKSHKIYIKLSGGKRLHLNDPNKSADMLKNTLEILERCESETDSCVEEMKQLEEVLNIGNNSTSISERCQLTTQRAQKWKESYENMKRNLDNTMKSVHVSYTELLEEPYYFIKPNRNEKSVKQTLPNWSRDFDIIVDSLNLCIKNNKHRMRNLVSREQLDKLNEENNRLHDQIKQLETDKDSAYSRLSKVAGARLTDNNPNIADLSDPNRPTKIAEQYSELYDSPWTDAYETLNKQKDEKECIEFLLGIIVNCYDICGELSRNHQMILRRAVCFPGGDKESTQASKTGKKDNSIFSAVQSKALSELRKQTADLSVDNVKSVIKSDHKEWFDSKGVLEKYTMLCIELCWLMHVQTPPVVIETLTKSGSKFDTNRFRQYTKAGKTVDFVVWPVLLLEEKGAILCKGVAQGKK